MKLKLNISEECAGVTPTGVSERWSLRIFHINKVFKKKKKKIILSYFQNKGLNKNQLFLEILDNDRNLLILE